MRDAARSAPFGRRLLTVRRATRELGAYVVLRVADPTGPPPRPGQFYMLAAAERWGGGEDERPFLPRAFSVARAARRASSSSCSRTSARARGGCASCAPGDGLWLLGPLGQRLRAAARRAGAPLLVGGGVGIAPLAILQDALGDGADACCSASATRAHAAGAALLRGAARRHRRRLGRPPRPRHRAARRASCGDDPHAEVYACGPPPMLEAVRALCAARGVPAQLALESGMACGFGACFGCVVPGAAAATCACASTAR